MGYYIELAALSLDELERCLERDGDYDDYYEEVVQHIVAQGALGLSYLRSVVQEARLDVPQLRAALWVLGLQEEGSWYREKLQTLLHDSRELIVAEAVDSLARIKARDLRKKILQLYTHPSPYVRGSVLRYVSKLFPNDAPPMLIVALKDPHYIIRENAIDELDDLEYYQALSDIRPFLHDQHEDVRQAAETAVENLTMVKEDKEAALQEKEVKKRSTSSTQSHIAQPGSTYL